MYHGIVKNYHNETNSRNLDAEQFEKQLRYYKKHFNILSLEELIELKKKSVEPSKQTIALTFDDGQLNNLEVALPLLEKYEIPATFFIITAPLDNEKYIYLSTLIEVIAAFSNDKTIEINGMYFFKTYRYKLTTKDGIDAYRYISSLDPDMQKKIMKELSTRYNSYELQKKLDDEVYKLLNKEQLKRLSRSPFASIGSHTHSHFNLSQLDNFTLKEELAKSKLILEGIIDKPVKTLAFPNGFYDERVIQEARNIGYENFILMGLNRQEDRIKKDYFDRAGISNSDCFEYNVINVSLNFYKFGF